MEKAGMIMVDHPRIEDFEDFFRGRSILDAGARNVRVLRHLLANCATCATELARVGWVNGRLEKLLYLGGGGSMAGEDLDLPRASTYNYDRAFAKAQAGVEALLAEIPPPSRPVDQLLAELELLSAPDQLRAVADDPCYACPQLVRRLVEKSHSVRFDQPKLMLQFATLALEAARRCEPGTAGGEARLADLQALTWGQMTSALRVGAQLRESEEAGNLALTTLKAGTGDPLLRAQIYLQVASVYQNQRRFEKAIDLMRESQEVYRRIGDSHALATALVQEAIVTIYSGEPEGALRLLHQAVPLIDQERDPHLLLAACHNLVVSYIELDRPEQALAIYSEISDLYKEIKGDLISLRVAWQHGALLRDLGHPQAAEPVLLRARSGFLDRGVALEAALISLDLASIYIKMGRVNDVRQTAEATVPIFRALGIEREELGAILQLQQVADQQQKALELVRFLSGRIQAGARDEVLP